MINDQGFQTFGVINRRIERDIFHSIISINIEFEFYS